MRGSAAAQAFVVVMTTVGSEQTARRIASALVERRLAACVNVVPGVESTYRWEGKVQTDAEQLLIVKTGRARLAEVEAAIRGLHDYELPEVLVLPVGGGSADYLRWIDESTRP